MKLFTCSSHKVHDVCGDSFCRVSGLLGTYAVTFSPPIHWKQQMGTFFFDTQDVPDTVACMPLQNRLYCCTKCVLYPIFIRYHVKENIHILCCHVEQQWKSFTQQAWCWAITKPHGITKALKLWPTRLVTQNPMQVYEAEMWYCTISRVLIYALCLVF